MVSMRSPRVAEPLPLSFGGQSSSMCSISELWKILRMASCLFFIGRLAVSYSPKRYVLLDGLMIRDVLSCVGWDGRLRAHLYRGESLGAH